MKERFPDGTALLILAAIRHCQDATIAAVLDALQASFKALWVPATVYSYLDTLVQRELVQRDKRPGPSAADKLRLTEKGEHVLGMFADGFYTLLPPPGRGEDGERKAG